MTLINTGLQPGGSCDSDHRSRLNGFRVCVSVTTALKRGVNEREDHMRAGLALGSNIGDRFENLRAARNAIVDLAGVEPPILVSPIFETDPVDCEPGAGKFWNAVLEIEFEGDAAKLLTELREIEVSLGRSPDHPRNVSRKIDIDLLYCGETTIESDDLHLPHPRMAQRKFVLQPLADIRPELILPGQTKTVRELLAQTTGMAKVVALPEQWK